MAKVETTRLVDDITGGDADETLDFGLDGLRFEIDLSSGNARRLRAELAPYLAAARAADTPGARRARARAASAPRPDDDEEPVAREHNRAVRAWAREHGYTVSERGRIPTGVVEAYRRGEQAGSPATAPNGSAVPDGPFAAGQAGPFGSGPDPASAGQGRVDADGRTATAPAVEFSG